MGLLQRVPSSVWVFPVWKVGLTLFLWPGGGLCLHRL